MKDAFSIRYNDYLVSLISKCVTVKRVNIDTEYKTIL